MRPPKTSLRPIAIAGRCLRAIIVALRSVRPAVGSDTPPGSPTTPVCGHSGPSGMAPFGREGGDPYREAARAPATGRPGEDAGDPLTARAAAALVGHPVRADLVPITLDEERAAGMAGR